MLTALGLVITTKDHPVWSVTDQRFEHADQLTDGEKVLVAGGRVITVSGFKVGATYSPRCPILLAMGLSHHAGKRQLAARRIWTHPGLPVGDARSRRGEGYRQGMLLVTSSPRARRTMLRALGEAGITASELPRTGRFHPISVNVEQDQEAAALRIVRAIDPAVQNR